MAKKKKRPQKKRRAKAPRVHGIEQPKPAEIEGDPFDAPGDGFFDDDDMLDDDDEKALASHRPMSRLESERLNRLVGKLLDERDFATIDEANEFLNREVSGLPIEELEAKFGFDEDPVEVAQSLAAQASEEEDSKKAADLAKRALSLDPHCVDAQMALAVNQALSTAELITACRRIIREAEAHLGEEFFSEHKGHFWGVVETRPYMRARATLVDLLIQRNQIEEAIAECEGMLELNPNDNQGMRDQLMGLSLEAERLDVARRLLKDYPSSGFATFLYGEVLERFLSGDQSGAAKALRLARKKNPFVWKILTGRKALPKKIPEYYKPGGMSEAQVCMMNIGQAWIKHPEALDWLER